MIKIDNTILIIENSTITNLFVIFLSQYLENALIIACDKEQNKELPSMKVQYRT